MKELTTIGIAQTAEDVEHLVAKGKEWIYKEEERRLPIWTCSVKSVIGVRRSR